jgi:hypothetical protein
MTWGFFLLRWRVALFERATTIRRSFLLGAPPLLINP